MNAAAGGHRRVLICGDTHGDTDWVRELVHVADIERCDAVVICGDFGYWTHYADGRRYIADVDAAVAASALDELVFIDGNHEYHATHPAKPPHRRTGLRELRTETHVDGAGFARISAHIRYASRGARWHWGNTDFGALGGAASTDREQRKRYRDWWVEETPTRTDLDALGTAPLDVLLCHDAPGTHTVFAPEDRIDDPRTLRVRALLSEAVDATTPHTVFHGHWHRRYDTTIGTPSGARVHIVGLGANVDRDDERGELSEACIVYDTVGGTTHGVAAPG